MCDWDVGKPACLGIHRGGRGQCFWGTAGSTEETEKYLGLAVGQRVLETHKQKLRMINPQGFEAVRGSALDRNKFSLSSIMAQK